MTLNSPVPFDADDVKRPAYQWYPGDFRRDVALQACSFEARALWRELLDLMHDGEPYGHLTAGGVPMSAATVARIVGVPAGRARKWLDELEAHKVFSRTEAGVIYSRRMVKDEHIRTVRAEAGKKGGNPALLDNHPSEDLLKQNDKQKPTPAVAVASALAENNPSASPHPLDVVDELLATIPEQARTSWASEIAAAKMGMHTKAMTDEQIALAVRDYLAQATFDDAGLMHKANMNHFRGFLRRALRPAIVVAPDVRPARMTKQEVGVQHLQAAIERRAAEAATNGE